MLTHLYLPALQEGKSPQMPEVTGKWDIYSKRILGAVADGIVVDQDAAARGVSSVPDVWARPLMFASVLRAGSGHPLRPRLVNEWRGFLSLLALSRVHKYDLELVRVDLQSGVFADALMKLAPKPVRLETDKTYNWTDVVIVRYDGIPIGGLSPQTLVYTGTDYAARLSSRTLNLKDAGGFLSPPVDREDQHAVGEWVVQLRRRLAPILHAEERDESRSTVGLINYLLKEWEIELRQQLGLGERDDVDSADVQVDEDALPVRAGESLLAGHRVYREILRPLVPSGAGSRVVSDVTLQGTRQLSKYATVVVISRSSIANNARVWQQKRLNNLGGDVEQVLARHFNGASGTVIDHEDLAQHGALWIRPERYFLTDRLIKAKHGSKFVAESEVAVNCDGRFLLPFRKEILDFFSPEDVQALSPEFARESDQAVTFRFKLPVGSTTERVEKTYRYKNPEAGEGTLLDVEVPTVELFPHFLDAAWRRYFMFQHGTSELVATPVVTAANASRVTRERTDSRGQKVLVTGTIGDTVRDDEGVALRFPFPEAVEFAMAGAPAGLLLLRRPEQPRPRSGDWRIGVDFGTSNTNVFRQSARAAEAERWVFRFTRYIHPVTASTTPVRSDCLLPDRDVPLPIPTHLSIHQEPLRQHVLLDYFVDLSTSYQVPDSVYTNIKWQDTDRKTEYFLESLLLMILLDAVEHRVNRVKFACSYPKAFSHTAISVFKGEWEKVTRRVFDGPARLLDTRRRAEDGHLHRETDAFEIEGVAAGEFFASEKTIPKKDDRANKANVALCLDVGGGTTDISIWFDNKIVADASVKLAGRQIGEILRRHFKILELLLSPEAVRSLEEQQALPDPFAARLNIALREEDQRIREMLIKHSNAHEVQALKRLLVCEFGAIAFYSAQLMAAADRHVANGELLSRVSSSGIGLHWGGNAAKFINWIDFGRFDSSGIGPMILNAIMFNTLRDSGVTLDGKSVAQHQSPGHKSEAAGGLVVMELGRPGHTGGGAGDMEMSSDGESGTVCGENIELTTRKVSYLESLTEKDLFTAQKTTFVRTSLDRLKRFLDIVNFFGVQRGVFTNDSKITLDDRRAVQVADGVRSSFVTAQGTSEGDREIEPVFIMEVKELLDRLKDDLDR